MSGDVLHANIARAVGTIIICVMVAWFGDREPRRQIAEAIVLPCHCCAGREKHCDCTAVGCRCEYGECAKP